MVLDRKPLFRDCIPATPSPDVRRAIFGDPKADCLTGNKAITAVLGYLGNDLLGQHCVAPASGARDIADQLPDPAYSPALLPLILDPIEFLRTATSADELEAIVDILVEAFPCMVAKLRDRQPHFVPGGKYSLLTPETTPQAAHSKVTTDSQEADHGLGDSFLTRHHSIETTDILVKARRNKVMAWFHSLPEEQQRWLWSASGPIARVNMAENKARKQSLQRKRQRKTQREIRTAKRTIVKSRKKVVNPSNYTLARLSLHVCVVHMCYSVCHHYASL
jgi:hypothetical protein